MADAVTDEQAVIEEDGDAILEVDLKKKGPGFMDNLKKSYMNKLKGKKQIKIVAPKGAQESRISRRHRARPGRPTNPHRREGVRSDF